MPRKLMLPILIVIALVAGSALAACSSQPASNTGTSANTTASVSDAYGSLFDNTQVHEIEITLDDADWQDLKDNPLDKTKYHADATVDSEKVSDVSFATKGNTSLSSVAMSDSDRYSFKVNFGKYQDGQTYHGLDKLNLNNMYADATYMKDYISYEIFRAAGVEAPLTSYTHLTINGEDFGLYLAVEDLDQSYLDRTEDGEGELYKPETADMDGAMKDGKGEDKETREAPKSKEANSDDPGDGDDSGKSGKSGVAMPSFNFNGSENSKAPDGMKKPDGDGSGMPQMPDGMKMPENMQLPEGMEIPEGMEMPEGMELPDGMDFKGSDMPSKPDGSSEGSQNPFGGFGGGGFGGFSMFGSSNGADLAYIDDDIESYSDIFDNDETKASDEDKARVVAALKELSEGNADAALDTDEVINYFAAHNFVLNYDSYTGVMLHNYYLYENNGKLSMLPWDYNLSFGGFGGGSMFSVNGSSSSSDSLVNTGIDSPVSGPSADTRPMWSWITSSDEYLEKYHEAYDKLLKEYFESGKCADEIKRVSEMIAPYVDSDVMFYSKEEHETAVDTLAKFISARAESIRAQIDGKLATTTSEQDESARIDASDIDVSSMGKMSMGQGGDRGDFRASGDDNNENDGESA